MPNICYNRLIVIGKSAGKFHSRFMGISKRVQSNQVKGICCLNNIVTMPEGIESQSDWARKNWGTSHDLYSEAITRKITKKFYYYKFKTSWNPPSTWIRKVSKLYPYASFILEFAIPMTGYAGLQRFDDGKSTYDSIDESYDLKRRLKRINSNSLKYVVSIA